MEDYSDFVDGGGELEAKLANYRVSISFLVQSLCYEVISDSIFSLIMY